MSKKYSRLKLLILDDFRIVPIVDGGTTSLFGIIEERANIDSTIITSQLLFELNILNAIFCILISLSKQIGYDCYV